jgi:hypothetical protein
VRCVTPQNRKDDVEAPDADSVEGSPRRRRGYERWSGTGVALRWCLAFYYDYDRFESARDDAAAAIQISGL